jgi:KUP system potassium uptake protein
MSTAIPGEPRRKPDEVPLSAGLTGARPIPAHRHHVEANPTGKRLAILTLTALGVVYGDIGTSPLYALKQAFGENYGLVLETPAVYGILSLMVWALIIVISIKYIAFIMRADNRGEGGILALLALILQRAHRAGDERRRFALIALGLVGASLLYGEGIITPAISVLSAVEGLEVLADKGHVAPALAAAAGDTLAMLGPRGDSIAAAATADAWGVAWILHKLIIPITLVIITAIFYFQRHGTARVGVVFGPIMLLWFATIAALGLREIIHAPAILQAASPHHGIMFLATHGAGGFLALGAVVLVITGGEALYADMGHFGRKPIRLAWFAFAMPCLLLNYFGQGALVLRDSTTKDNPFFHLAPVSLLLPLVVLATAAAIIASQALISGAFSLTQQSVQLGYSPRMTIVHTSARAAGQIYIPEVNKALWVGCVVLVLGFRSSTNLASAYGIAVTGTMAISSVLFFVVARIRWNWPLGRIAALTGLFLLIDLAFLGANVPKIIHGGWVPLVFATTLFAAMTTWKRGREILRDILRRGSLPLDLFLEDVERRKPHRVRGTAVFMTSEPEGTPVVLLHHIKHNQVLHEQVLLLSVMSAEVPEVADMERVSVERLAHGFFRVTARYGFMETPDVKEILALVVEHGVTTIPHETSYYLGRERLIPIGNSPMWTWRKKLFIFMSRNAIGATQYFGIPPNRVVELGTQIEL